MNTWTPPPFSIEEWTSVLVAKYPQVRKVILAGSRGHGPGHLSSDYDVVLFLDSDDAEQLIGGDELIHPPVDLFFIREDGTLRQWSQRDAPALANGEPMPWKLHTWRPFFDDLKRGRVLYEAAP